MPCQVTNFVDSHSANLRDLRRQFHQIPEMGWEEYLTSWRIYQFLEKLSIPFDFVIGRELLASESRFGLPDDKALAAALARLQTVSAELWFIDLMKDGHTGLMASFDSGKPGPDVFFRFDIDALPIQESSGQDHIPTKQKFESATPGIMHACGHDFHIATGLGLALFLERVSEQLCGKVHLLFQPAEEGCRGARAVADKGWLNKADYFVSGHVGIEDHPVGTVAVTTGEMLATSKLDISFSGRSAHAANNPQDGNNALLAAASSAIGLHGISRHSGGSSRVNVGTLNAGSGRNIIADSASMMAELRGENNEIHDYMLDRARDVVTGAAKMQDVDHQIKLSGQALAGHCDTELAERIGNIIEASPKVHQVHPELLLRASEDASILMDAVQQAGGKATYLMFCSPSKGGHHHCEFDIDEAVLDVALDVMSRTLLELSAS